MNARRLLALLVIATHAACVPAAVQPPRGAPIPQVAGTPVEQLPLRALVLPNATAELWRPDLRPAWRAPSASEASALASLVVRVSEAARSGFIHPDYASLATAAGVIVERWVVDGRAHLVVREPPEARHGMGAYVFADERAPLPASWLLWQAPHAYHDVDTGRIAALLYFAASSGPHPAAFFTNSLHRYTQDDGSRAKRTTNPADACHNADHPFQIATAALAAAQPGVTVIQLHGFAGDPEPDDDDDGRLPDGTTMVVSAGRKDAPDALSGLAAEGLRTLLGSGVRLFPTEASALGATTNVQGRSLRTVPGARFLHLEMVSALRTTLVRDATMRAAFGDLLFDLASTPDSPSAH